MPDPRVAFCLFCDDIRLEVGNKPSFMGIYTGGEMVFPPDMPSGQPALIPKLAMPVWLVCDKGDVPEKLVAYVHAPPGRTEYMRQEIPLDPPAMPSDVSQEARKIYLHFQIGLVNLQLETSGVVEVTVETELGQLRAGRLRITIPGRPDPAVQTDESGASATAGNEGPFKSKGGLRRRTRV